MTMRFEIRVRDAIFEWRDGKLICTSKNVMELLKEELAFREPKLIAMPDMIDYDDDLTDGENAYNAILGTFPDCEVIVKPAAEDLYQFDPNVIY